MKHYELLTLVPGADAEAVRHKVWKAYDKLDSELDWLNKPVVYRTCRPDDEAGADIMATFELDNEEQLLQYVNHPIHVKLVDSLKDKVASRMAFDHY